MVSILLLVIGIVIGWLWGSRREGELKRTVDRLTEVIIRLDREEKSIVNKIKKGQFKGRRLAERKTIVGLYRIKIQAYIWCLENLTELTGRIAKIWKRRKKDYSYDYSDVFKKKKYCQKCKSLY